MPTAEVPVSPRRRDTAVDAARGLALLGMFFAHAAPGLPLDSPFEIVAWATEEKPRLLFALTAGIGLGYLTMRAWRAGVGRGRVRGQLAIRAVLVILIGLGLTALGPLLYVVLEEYGVAFIVLIPFLFLPASVLLALGIGLLVVASIGSAVFGGRPGFDPDASISGFIGDLLLTGVYPVLIWVPIMMIGLALARLGLHRRRVAYTAGAIGIAGVAVFEPLAQNSTALYVPLVAQTLSAFSVGLVVVALLTAIVTFTPRRVGGVATAVLSPLAAAGSMPLTIYSAHVVVLAATIHEVNGYLTDDSWPVLIALVVGSLAFAWVWRRFIGRGPLEWLIGVASGRLPLRRRRAEPLAPVD